ncbi:MAG: FkbM family methyltransferase [Nitrososphaerota archaeon]
MSIFTLNLRGTFRVCIAGCAWSKRIRIEATTLGALFRGLGVVFDLVKIDIEGAEPFLLDDLSEFREFWKMVVVEVHGKAVGRTCGCSFCRKASGLGLDITTVSESRLVHHVVLKKLCK